MRIGVVSDIHGQADALATAIAAMGRIDGLICLGDAISEAQFCNRTVGLLRAEGAQAILGNHEEAFFAGSGRNGPGVDPSLADWLAQRPMRIDTTLGDLRTLVVHATPWFSNHAYIPPTHRDFDRFAASGHDVVLYGHTHQPVIRQVGGTLIVNPGSVGEGRPTAAGFVRSCAVLDTAARTAAVIDLD